ncbi:MAG: ABC transporter permease [Pseudomonadota bacterium]
MTAISDIVDGSRRFNLAFALAWEDLKDRYRRSYIGLAWIILSFLAFILVKQLVFSGFFENDDYDFFSHLVIGFALFGFINSTVSGAANLFVSNRTWILSCNLPYTIYAHVLALRSLAELAIIAIAAAFLIAMSGDARPGFVWSLFVAVSLYYVTAIALCLAFGPIGVRYRDFVYALQTVMRVMFFATPIIWVAQPGTIRGAIAFWNPLTYYLDIIRVPIIEGRVPWGSWGITLAFTSIIALLGLWNFSRTKRNVPLWL